MKRDPANAPQKIRASEVKLRKDTKKAGEERIDVIINLDRARSPRLFFPGVAASR